MTPQHLFAFARGLAENGHPFPTVREAAKRFHTSQQAVLDACDDWQGDGYMQPAVGLRSGSGVGVFERTGDYLVEAYETR